MQITTIEQLPYLANAITRLRAKAITIKQRSDFMNAKYVERIRKGEHKKIDVYFENKKRPQVTIYGEGLPRTKLLTE